MLAAEFNTTSPTIRKALFRSGSAPRGHRHYHFNEGAFAQAELNPTAAYFVGFLFADGCVLDKQAGQKTISLQVSCRDIAIVEALREFVESGHPVTKDNRGFCSLKLPSDRMATDLAQFGIVPRKSLTATVSQTMAFNADFWRGVVDGDGFVSISRHDRQPLVGLAGSLPTCEAFRDFVRSISSALVKPSPHKSIFNSRVYSTHAFRLTRALYGHNGVALARKQANANAIISLGLSKGILPTE